MPRSKDSDLCDLEDACAAVAQQEPTSAALETAALQEILPPQDLLIDLTEKTPIPFDYSKFDRKHRIALQGHQARIYKKTKKFMFELGEELLQARELLVKHYHGSWGKWRDSTFPMKKSTIDNIMKATEWHRKCPTVGQMDLKALYAGMRASSEVQAEIVRRIGIGNVPSFDDVEALKRADKSCLHGGPEHEKLIDATGRALAPAVATGERLSVDADAIAVGSSDDAVEASTLADRGDASVVAAPTDLAATTVPQITEAGDRADRASASSEAVRSTNARAAATELVARLREYVEEDHVIVELIELWQLTSYDDVRALL